MKSRSFHICIGGEAGQGLQTCGQMLSEVLVKGGYAILTSQTYHSRIRGGHNTFSIQCGIDRPLAPSARIDLLVAFNGESVTLHREELNPDGLMVVDEKFGQEGDGFLRVPFGDLAGKRYLNIAALGVAGALLGIDQAVALEIVDKWFSKKSDKIREENRQALAKGYEWTGERRPVSFPGLPETTAKEKRLLMTCNDAIALGALSAGLSFCSFYPMTPATSVILTVIAHADRLRVVVEQAEDEIAAVNMAIGASFAGAPSMVATSGGGFALMSEGVSLAAMTETPLVLVVGQRPGPATGLPTRTEQGDLEFVLHAGHGEFPRAVLAPASAVDCFRLTQKAFNLAEETQGPVFILTDQYLADSLQDFVPARLPEPHPVVAGGKADPGKLPYQRYAFTESGVSPRLLPGRSEHLVVADSDEHYEDGHITEDLSIRVSMVEKRLKKLAILKKQVIIPEYEGEGKADLLLVCWGSTRGAVLQTARALRQEKKQSVATLHFCQVWPLMESMFIDRLRSARKVVVVEGNAIGQFARLLRRETGFQPHAVIGRYDGLPFTAEYILERLEKMG